MAFRALSHPISIGGEEHMAKSWIRAIVLSVTALLCWCVAIVFNPPHFEFLLGIFAVVLSVLSVCFLTIAMIRQIKPDVSGYKIFAWTDALIGAGVVLYAIYDMLTATGWFAGIVGFLLLIIAVPIVILLLILDFVFYKWNKKAQAAPDNSADTAKKS